jgi:hypothetical protein
VQFDDATNIGTVGITDYAQKALGDVVFVELPQVDSEVTQAGTYTYTYLHAHAVSLLRIFLCQGVLADLNLYTP